MSIMPRSAVSNTVKGQGLKSQGLGFAEFPDDPSPQYQKNGQNKKQHSDNFVAEITAQLLALTPPQQRVVRAVAKFPGSNSVEIGQIIHLTRYAALAHLNYLADVKSILRSNKSDSSRGGSRKAIHFWLAAGISAELVEAILRNANTEPEVLPKVRQQSPEEKTSMNSEQAPNLNPVALFATLPPLAKKVILALAQIGDKGSSAPELSRLMEQQVSRIYEQLALALNVGLVIKELVPGFKRKSTYRLLPEVLEVVKQLSVNLTEEPQVISTPASNTDTFEELDNSTMNNSYQEELPDDQILQLIQDNQQMVKEYQQWINDYQQILESIHCITQENVQLRQKCKPIDQSEPSSSNEQLKTTLSNLKRLYVAQWTNHAKR